MGITNFLPLTCVCHPDMHVVKEYNKESKAPLIRIFAIDHSTPEILASQLAKIESYISKHPNGKRLFVEGSVDFISAITDFKKCNVEVRTWDDNQFNNTMKTFFSCFPNISSQEKIDTKTIKFLKLVAERFESFQINDFPYLDWETTLEQFLLGKKLSNELTEEAYSLRANSFFSHLNSVKSGADFIIGKGHVFSYEYFDEKRNKAFAEFEKTIYSNQQPTKILEPTIDPN
ncbi:MAG: hypothetical protein H7A37_02125 [Chlamydiales bacterium]|nr:hypothetical protein [Chlamydiales bacterium]